MPTNIINQTDAFFSQFPAFSFKTDELLIQAGESPNLVYYLKSGIVKQSSISPQGQEIVITFYKPGAFFPLIWVVKNTPLPYDFRAVTDGQGWKAPKEAVITFLKQNSEVTFDLVTRLLSGLEGLGRKLEYALQTSAYLRIGETLLTLARRFNRTEKGQVKIDLALTHQELADITGLTRETVSRELKVLRQQGLITIDKQIFIIPDVEVLEHSLGLGGEKLL